MGTTAMLFLVGCALGILAGMLLCVKGGIWWERRRAKAEAGTPEAGAGAAGLVNAAVFGLLGLLIAFTFSGAASRMDARRQLVIRESEAIGTAYLRIDLLPADAQPSLRRLFRHYLETRLDMHEYLLDPEALQRERAQLSKMQDEIWSTAAEACKGQPGPAGMLLLPTINQMIDISAARYTAATIHVPMIVLVALVALSLLSAFLLGVGLSPRKTGILLPSLLFALAFSISLFVILDLEFPRVGLIQMDAADDAMRQLLNTVKAS